ncbi:MAG: molybdenum cofactor guanylyltransferase MobA [Burkholderiaceae bacterium]
MSTPGVSREQICGLVLAGGLGRRMSRDGRGTNKALTPFRGRPMIAHVIDRLKPQVGQLMLNVNQDADQFSQFNLPLIADEVGGFAGPLAGLHAGLTAATTDWVLTCPCDSPFLPDNLAASLADAALQEGADLAVVTTDGRAQPVFTLVRRDLLSNLADFLSSGGRKIDAWYAPLKVASVAFADSAAFRNINTPEDLARFESVPQADYRETNSPETANYETANRKTDTPND